MIVINNDISSHVETVCLLSNKNYKAENCVEIGIDAEEYYAIKNGESKKEVR